jgi:hypothetical protein
VDPNEWTNQAANPEHAKLKNRMSKLIPREQHAGLKVKDWFDKFQD